MIEINLNKLQKGEQTIRVKAHQTKKGYVKEYSRKIKTTKPTTEMDVKLAARKNFTDTAKRTNDWIDAHPEMEDDVETVYRYTVDRYDEINYYLGHGEVMYPSTREEDATIKAGIVQESNKISGFLRNAPKFTGTVYRGKFKRVDTELGLKKYNDFMDNINSSDTIVMKSFTSTTADRSIAEKYIRKKISTKGNIMFEMTSKQGVALGKASEYSGECEVLFDKNTEFKIINVDVSNEGTYIKLEEL